MEFNREWFKSQIPALEKLISEHKLPAWNELSDIGLYMDQVILLMNEYLSIYIFNDSETKVITPSIINNYVKMGVIPPPEKKKYSRVHLAYLIMVCSLKQSLSIATIKKIIPSDLSTEAMEKIYTSFLENEYAVFKSLSDELTSSLSPLIDEENNNDEFYSLIMQSALSASAFKMLTDKMTLQPNNESDENNKNNKNNEKKKNN